jgi:uncharacterized protein YndB with AHSA1/START domain
MNHSKFLYVTFIRTTPEKLWEALRSPEFTKKYWFGCWQECDWKKGSKWTLHMSDGKIADGGEVIEIDPPKKLVLQWRNHWKPELHAEGPSRATFTLEPTGETVKLTVLHELETVLPDSKFIGAVSNGWPAILSGLKSLLETGTALERPTGV